MQLLEKILDLNLRKIVRCSRAVLGMGCTFDKLQGNQNDVIQSFWNDFCEAGNSYQGDFPEIFANRPCCFNSKELKKRLARPKLTVMFL
jgi:hypothetical protein